MDDVRVVCLFEINTTKSIKHKFTSLEMHNTNYIKTQAGGMTNIFDS